MSEKPSYKKSFWDSYRNLPKRTRIILGVSGIAFSLVGMKFSEHLENKLPSDNNSDNNNIQ